MPLLGQVSGLLWSEFAWYSEFQTQLRNCLGRLSLLKSIAPESRAERPMLFTAPRRSGKLLTASPSPCSRRQNPISTRSSSFRNRDSARGDLNPPSPTSAQRSPTTPCILLPRFGKTLSRASIGFRRQDGRQFAHSLAHSHL
jgi:hypothetical protein